VCVPSGFATRRIADSCEHISWADRAQPYVPMKLQLRDRSMDNQRFFASLGMAFYDEL